MPRKGPAKKRDIAPDPVYQNRLLSRFMNRILISGKKGVAEKFVYGALEIVEDRTKRPGIQGFEEAMRNVMPMVEVRPRRVGGATYQVPIEIRTERRQTLGLRWLVSFARKRGERTISARLAGEIMDGANSQGNAFKKKEDTHKMAEANKAFAHYRW
jgi:small subunit ribosomal protein S7